MREQGLAGLESVGFQGLVGPPGLPREVMDRLTAALRKVLATADAKSQFAAAGVDVQPRGPQEFAAYVRAEAERWSGLISKRGIKVD